MIEAYGVKGMKSKPWRKTFASDEALTAWAEKNSAEIHGVRETEPDRNARIIESGYDAYAREEGHYDD